MKQRLVIFFSHQACDAQHMMCVGQSKLYVRASDTVSEHACKRACKCTCACQTRLSCISVFIMECAK